MTPNIRQMVSANINMFYIYQLPIPRLTQKDSSFTAIVERAAKLICTASEFDDLAREVGLRGHVDGVTDPTERARLRAELDGMVAHLYGLTETEFRHVLSTFPLVEQSVKDAALDAYLQLVPHPDDAQVAALIARGESDRVEFKVAALWNAHANRRDDKMKENVVEEVVAFLNSSQGGAVLIGVEDSGHVAGLRDDYAAAEPRKKNRDGYSLWLGDVLSTRLRRGPTPEYSITFHEIAGEDVCRIQINPAKEPVYLDGDFYVRDGPRKRKLSAADAIKYIAQRFTKD